MKISVFGLGKVGLTLSSCLAAAGHDVIGVDISERLVDALNDGSLKTGEPGVQERLDRTAGKSLTATLSVEDAVRDSDLSFLIVPTPSNTLGGFSIQYVLNACHQIGEALRTKSGDHVVALVSTVLPGSSDHAIIPALEAASGRRIGSGLGYCYNPSFIALGEITRGIEQPDYLLIGESDPASGALVLEAHRAMVPAGTPIARMKPVEAEITKLASNTHETMRVSFANMLLSVCSEIPGANVDRITGALTHRMGKRFFKGAVPYGGPCWPRDNEALSVFMDMIGVPSRMPRNVDLFNEEHGRFILGKVLGLAPAGSTVGIVGMAYKPGTDVIERAYGVDLARWLVAERRSVVAWDPLALGASRTALTSGVSFAENAAGCLSASEVIVIVNPLPQLAEIDWSLAGDKIVIDCWRALSPEQAGRIGRYVGLGAGAIDDAPLWSNERIAKTLNLLTN